MVLIKSALIYAFLGCLFTFLMTSIGALSVLFIKGNNITKLKNISYGFASGVMLAAAVWSLLIPSMEYAEKLNVSPVLSSAGGFTLGVLFIIIFDRIINRSEKINKDSKSNTLLISAITIHNIPEGMAVGLSFANAVKENDPALLASSVALAIGIGIQNFPEGAAVALPLRQNGVNKYKSFLYGSLSGIAEPIFGVLAVIISGYIAFYIPWFLSFAAGAMFLAVVKELLPSANELCDEKSENLYGSVGASIGFLIMMVLDISL